MIDILLTHHHESGAFLPSIPSLLHLPHPSNSASPINNQPAKQKNEVVCVCVCVLCVCACAIVCLWGVHSFVVRQGLAIAIPVRSTARLKIYAQRITSLFLEKKTKKKLSMALITALLVRFLLRFLCHVAVICYLFRNRVRSGNEARYVYCTFNLTFILTRLHSICISISNLNPATPPILVWFAALHCNHATAPRTWLLIKQRRSLGYQI